ncbi:MAG: branched-chain amino acid ABC transporter permease [Ferruginibacter sp.]|nr:branched-chain amino acid ABC transporter permease [Rhodoferax sp.]
MNSPLVFTVERSTRSSHISAGVGTIMAVALLSLPFWGDASQMRWVVEVVCLLVMAQMWNLLAGYGGLISVGQQAFVGIGGYALFVFAQHGGVNPFWAIPLAGLTAAVLAVPTAKIAFRLRGGHFAVGTWVISEVFRILVSNLPLLGGGSGQSLTVMARIPKDTRESVTYWVACALLIGSFVLVYALLRSRLGLGLTAVRDSEAAAESQGIHVVRLKFQVFVLSAFGTGLAGALYYLNVLRISPGSAFDLGWVVAAIFIVVIGGIGTLEGPIVGAAVFFFLRWLLADYGSVYWMVLGAVAIAVMVRFPKGLWGFVQQRYGVQFFPLQRRLDV